MSFRNTFAGFALGTITAVTAGLALNQGPTVEPAQDPMDDAAMNEGMEAWLSTINPGPEHEFLTRAVGTWDATMKMWWGGPGLDPIEMEARSECRMVLGGRYLQEDFTGQTMMPNEQGQMEPIEFTGIGLNGYDRVRNLYTSVWADSISTQTMLLKGSRTDENTITLYGEMDEPMMGVFGRMVKYETTWQDDDTRTFAIYDLHASSGYKVIEITYRRVKE